MAFTPQAIAGISGNSNLADFTKLGNSPKEEASIPVTSTLDFSNMSANDISTFAQNNPEWYSQNASLVDYWLNEKSYYNRASNNIKSQYQQLKDLGINPVLAMSLLGNTGVSLSGGAQSSSDSYFSSKYASDQSAQSSKYASDQSAQSKRETLLLNLLKVGITIAGLIALA